MSSWPTNQELSRGSSNGRLLIVLHASLMENSRVFASVAEGELVDCAVQSNHGWATSSTRRFLARPSSVALLATGA